MEYKVSSRYWRENWHLIRLPIDKPACDMEMKIIDMENPPPMSMIETSNALNHQNENTKQKPSKNWGGLPEM